jgi:hypothetical protein
MGNAGRLTVQMKFNLQTNVAQLLQSYGVVSEARPLGRATWFKFNLNDPASCPCLRAGFRHYLLR